MPTDICNMLRRKIERHSNSFSVVELGDTKADKFQVAVNDVELVDFLETLSIPATHSIPANIIPFNDLATIYSQIKLQRERNNLPLGKPMIFIIGAWYDYNNHWSTSDIPYLARAISEFYMNLNSYEDKNLHVVVLADKEMVSMLLRNDTRIEADCHYVNEVE